MRPGINKGFLFLTLALLLGLVGCVQYEGPRTTSAPSPTATQLDNPTIAPSPISTARVTEARRLSPTLAPIPTATRRLSPTPPEATATPSPSSTPLPSSTAMPTPAPTDTPLLSPIAILTPTPTTRPFPSPTAVKGIQKLTLYILYDNNEYDARFQTAWGFACLIEAEGRRILFDTGGNSQILLSNMALLSLDVQDIDVVILSHIHGDHTGGLGGILARNHSVTAYVPQSFPESFKRRVREQASLVEITAPRELFPNIHSTGEMGRGIIEQSLVIESVKGLVIVTGCAHPGVVEIVARAKEMLGGQIYLVLGGFHLGGRSAADIEQVLAGFRHLGVKKLAPCHCTGKLALELMEKEYGEDFIRNGVGKVLRIEAEVPQ